jgi:hypothetical protein
VIRGSLACLGRCEELVATIAQNIENSIETFSTAAQTHRRAGTTAVAVGVLFAGMGGAFLKFAARGDGFGEYLGYSFIALGAVLAMNGFRNIAVGRRYARLSPKKIEDKV